MSEAPRMRTGGQQIVDALLRHGVDVTFGVPGESYLDVLAALHARSDAIRMVSCRHEGGAAFAADAWGKLTGRPGVCMVTRGPGASNAAIGVHTAFQDSTPLILLVGQVGRDMIERDAFQEVDYRRMFGPMAKWVAQIDDVSRVAEMMDRAFAVAMAGRPGPVVLALPEDMLTDSSAVLPAPPPTVVDRPQPSPASMRHLAGLLAGARRPLLWLGGPGWSDAGSAAILAFARRWGLPVTCSFRRQDLVDNDDDHYVGETGIGLNPELAAAIGRSDLLIVVGARLGEMPTSGYTLVRVPYPTQAMVHVLAGPEELGRVYQPTLAIQSGPDAFAELAATLVPPDDDAAADARTAWRTALRRHYEVWSTPVARPMALDPARVILALREQAGPDAILTNGAGNYSAWAHRYYRHRGRRTQLAPTSGAMGYGVPAAIAARIRFPERRVVCLAGDGCFLMTSQELATARQQRLAIVWIVFDNGQYGTIRMHQEMHYPGRTLATDLVNPDFVAYAAAFGIPGERVEADAGIAPALTRAFDSADGYLIHLVLDPEYITPRSTITALRRAAA